MGYSRGGKGGPRKQMVVNLPYFNYTTITHSGLSLSFYIKNKNNSKKISTVISNLQVEVFFRNYTWGLGIPPGGNIAQFRDGGLTSLEKLKFYYIFLVFIKI